MQQILKRVIRTTSITMCLCVAVAMVPTVTQAHGGVVININASPSANGKAPVPVVINKSANAGSSCNICELQAVTGPCKAFLPRYYYDVDARACKKFTYGGCEGNQNRFLTSKDCEAKCVNSPIISEAATTNINDCYINGIPAGTYYQCNKNFDHFLYTSGVTTHVFEQTSGNSCVWVSKTVTSFHLTSVPGGGNSDMHVTFQNDGSHCGVVMNDNNKCSSSDTSICSSTEKDIAIQACEGFSLACDAQ